MSNTKRKPVRDGRSLTLSHANVPEKQLIDFGLSEAAAKRAMRVRNVLPYMEDPTIPCIDAKGLWSKIGKPHKQFTDWANYHIKPLLSGAEHNPEISVFEVANKKGKPTKHYTLSRSQAAHLAMQFKTPESEEVRCYFMDMERIAIKLVEYNYSRVHGPVKADNRMTHAAYKRKPERATDHERMMKSYVCKVLTSLGASEVKLKYRMGIRDVLRNYPDQLERYTEALNMAVSMYESGMMWAEIEPILTRVHGGKIDLKKLLAPQQ